MVLFFFSSRRRHTRWNCDWSSDVCSSDLNLYGDILSDIGAGLVGGLGVAPGANCGDDVAVFEPTHGSAPKYAGLNRINPMAMMLSGVLMLRHIGEDEAAARL